MVNDGTKEGKGRGQMFVVENLTNYRFSIIFSARLGASKSRAIYYTPIPLPLVLLKPRCKHDDRFGERRSTFIDRDDEGWTRDN